MPNCFRLCIFLGGSDSEEYACNAGDPGSISELGRSPGEGNGNPLQYSCLENSMEKRAWGAIVYEVAKSWEWLSNQAQAAVVRPGRGPGGATQLPRSGGCVGAGGPRGAIPRRRSGRAAVRRYLSSKVRSRGYALLEQPWRDTPRPR